MASSGSDKAGREVAQKSNNTRMDRVRSTSSAVVERMSSMTNLMSLRRQPKSEEEKHDAVILRKDGDFTSVQNEVVPVEYQLNGKTIVSLEKDCRREIHSDILVDFQTILLVDTDVLAAQNEEKVEELGRIVALVSVECANYWVLRGWPFIVVPLSEPQMELRQVATGDKVVTYDLESGELGWVNDTSCHLAIQMRMEHIPKGSLKENPQVVTRVRQDARLRKRFMDHVAWGLAPIHAKGMHHGDLTLDTLMYHCFSSDSTDEGDEKMLVENLKVNVATAGKFLGQHVGRGYALMDVFFQYEYFSPERMEKAYAAQGVVVDPRVFDMYSVGLIFTLFCIDLPLNIGRDDLHLPQWLHSQSIPLCEYEAVKDLRMREQYPVEFALVSALTHVDPSNRVSIGKLLLFLSRVEVDAQRNCLTFEGGSGDVHDVLHFFSCSSSSQPAIMPDQLDHEDEHKMIDIDLQRPNEGHDDDDDEKVLPVQLEDDEDVSTTTKPFEAAADDNEVEDPDADAEKKEMFDLVVGALEMSETESKVEEVHVDAQTETNELKNGNQHETGDKVEKPTMEDDNVVIEVQTSEAMNAWKGELNFEDLSRAEKDEVELFRIESWVGFHLPVYQPTKCEKTWMWAQKFFVLGLVLTILILLIIAATLNNNVSHSQVLLVLFLSYVTAMVSCGVLQPVFVWIGSRSWVVSFEIVYWLHLLALVLVAMSARVEIVRIWAILMVITKFFLSYELYGFSQIDKRLVQPVLKTVTWEFVSVQFRTIFLGVFLVLFFQFTVALVGSYAFVGAQLDVLKIILLYFFAWLLTIPRIMYHYISVRTIRSTYTHSESSQPLRDGLRFAMAHIVDLSVACLLVITNPIGFFLMNFCLVAQRILIAILACLVIEDGTNGKEERCGFCVCAVLGALSAVYLLRKIAKFSLNLTSKNIVTFIGLKDCPIYKAVAFQWSQSRGARRHGSSRVATDNSALTYITNLCALVGITTYFLGSALDASSGVFAGIVGYSASRTLFEFLDAFLQLTETSYEEAGDILASIDPSFLALKNEANSEYQEMMREHTGKDYTEPLVADNRNDEPQVHLAVAHHEKVEVVHQQG